MNSYSQLFKETKSRVFIKKALDLRRLETNLSQSAFSKKAGFSSRSFLSEYLSGKKKLSFDSFQKIKSALWLGREYKEYFSLLVQLEQPELFNSVKIETSDLNRFAQKLEQKNEALTKIGKTSRFIGTPDVFRVFASLGCEQLGSSYAEINERAKLSSVRLKLAIDIMMREGLIKLREGRFFPVTSQIDILHLKDKELVSLTKSVCSEISNDAEHMINENGSLLFYSCVSIDAIRSREFKEKIREALYQVFDIYQDDKGTEVRQVFVSVKI